MSANHSGFSNYPFASIYPGWGTGVTQTMDTTPEADEQAVYTSTEGSEPTAVDSKSKMNMFMLLGGIVLLIILFGR